MHRYSVIYMRKINVGDLLRKLREKTFFFGFSTMVLNLLKI
jgi:hypothetical protein